MRQTLPRLERKSLVKLAEQTLWSSEGKEHLAYLREKRRISDEQMKSLHFGYVPATWRGHELTGRLIMPLYDSYGELVCCTTRDISPNCPKERKHWHERFNKKKYLYGLDTAKKSIIERKKVIVVEGQFDVAYLRSIGFQFTVAMLGTVLNSYQASLLLRYCSEVYLLFDGDNGGVSATERTMKMYREYHLNQYGVLFVPVPTPMGMDPDELSREDVISLCSKAKANALKHEE